MSLDDVLGSEVAVLSLKAYAKTLVSPSARRWPLLFIGPAGSGKTMLAEAFAQETGADLIRVSVDFDPDELSLLLGLDTPKIFLVEEVDRLDPDLAVQFWMKATDLHVLWVFTAQSETQVPSLFQARSVTFRMLPVEPQILRSRALDAGVDESDVDLVVRRSEGCVGVLDREIHAYLMSAGFPVQQDKIAQRLAVALIKGDRQAAVALADEFFTVHAGPDILLAKLEQFFSDVLAVQAGAESPNVLITKISSLLPESRLVGLIKVVWQLQDRSRITSSPAVVVKAGLIMVCAAMVPPKEDVEIPEPEDQPLSLADMKELLQKQGLA